MTSLIFHHGHSVRKEREVFLSVFRIHFQWNYPGLRVGRVKLRLNKSLFKTTRLKVVPILLSFSTFTMIAVTDPGFPVGGRQLPTQALFRENVCENERIGSRWGGGGAGGAPWIRQCIDKMVNKGRYQH